MRTTGNLFTLPAPIRDAGLLLARALLGAVLIAHGWQKLHTNGIDATTAMFDKMSVPAPHASAWFAALTELIGGGMLVLGVLTPLAGLLVAVDLAGAWWFVHRSYGVFVDESGWELVAALGLAAFVFALVGPGRWSVDGLLNRLRSRGATSDESRTPNALTHEDTAARGAHVAGAATDATADDARATAPA